MKKIIAIALVALLVLTGCQGKINTPGQAEAKTYKIGTSVLSNVVIAAPEGDKKGKFEANVTYVTVALEDDKFAYVTIDEAQNALEFTNDDTVEPFVARKTKKELGDDYGMSKAGKVEWDKQVKELETHLIGKTLAEVKAGDIESDLNSTVSITITGFLTAIEQAVEKAVVVEDVVGIANASVTTGDFKDGKGEIGTTVSAVATNDKGEVVYAFIDETKLETTIADGVATSTGSLLTKGQQKEDYGMSAAGKKEWYLQVEHLTDWVIGKSKDEIAKAGDNADVTSVVSVYKGNFVNALLAALAKIK